MLNCHQPDMDIQALNNEVKSQKAEVPINIFRKDKWHKNGLVILLLENQDESES